MFSADRYSVRFRPPVRAVAASALTVSFLLLAGCGGGGGGGSTAAPSPSATANDFGCLSPAQAKAGSVTFPSSEGQDVEGFRTGTGTTALVLAHQADGDVCQWVPNALDLAKEGYTVLAVDSAGSEVPEITAAATYLRGRGAKKVLLVGASKGGTSVLSAAAEITPKVDAVVSLSAPGTYNGMDASSAVPTLTMPVFYMAAQDDTEFAESTKALSKATKKAAENDLHIVGGANHGVSMLSDPANYAQVKAFLKKYGS
ncbi:dienelactone hydrolase family protein [Streptomyces sp. NPDC051976]|uniref:alpha/beta hydrolase family protein n=1 Tax=Streptomyces sp. NPDC051976 TaxID=3154947 RepID=UPI00343FD0AF